MTTPPAPPDDDGPWYTKPINKTIGVLGDTPMLLVLTLLNAAMFGMITWLVMQSAQYRFKEREQIMQTLSECIEKLHEVHPGAHADVKVGKMGNSQ